MSPEVRLREECAIFLDWIDGSLQCGCEILLCLDLMLVSLSCILCIL
jgi:hypothetical protein